MERTIYLGDGAYIRYVNDFEIVIFCYDGVLEYNRIYLELDGVKKLAEFVEKVRTAV